ncbi:hypothetical protein [Cohnella panacarvi]|uniref:hypothetical protein n=1 Tax=Cohnella panacarvi TaxID=400776 RepID=UPI00047B286A|nr:hypothetical protein [Cohnella panacarvi]
MNGKLAGWITGFAGRLLFEWAIWVPAWLLLTIGHGQESRLLSLAAVPACWAIGLALMRLRPPWQLLATILFMIAVAAGAAAIDIHEASIGIWLAVVAWRGKYANITAGQFGIGFAVACAGVFVATGYDAAEKYRFGFIVVAIVWLAVWLIAWNRSLVSQAGLDSKIATRAVRKESRKYAFLFVALALIAFGLTISHALDWMRLPQVDIGSSRTDDIVPPTPREPAQGLPFKVDEDYRPNPIWDILFWIITVFSLFLLWKFFVWMWRDRKWSWQAIKDALRSLFMRDRREEKLPYVEERRSLAKEKRKSRWSGLFQRQSRGPDWVQLNNGQKVRRLYADAVAAGLTSGYPHAANLTPAESLESLERWRAEQAEPKSGNRAAYWRWFAGVRLALLRMYEQARYSPHGIEEHQVADLIERHPERDKLR